MDFSERAVADSRDRDAWLAARPDKIGASDAAKYAKLVSAPLYARDKIHNPFNGNAYTRHGNDREVGMLAHFRFPQNTIMYRSAGNARHVATPDGIIDVGGEVVLAQCKTAVKPLPAKIPPAYQRQMWWEQYVMGASRTLLIWEHHDGFQPVSMEPVGVWFYRDDDAIATLIQIADIVLGGLDAAARFKSEMQMEGTNR